MASDRLELLQKLERQIDRLLDRCQSLSGEVEQLRNENQSLMRERERVGVELDRILGKLADLDGETP